MTQQRPQDLIFTLFGDYFLHRAEPVWVGSLIDLLQALGLSEAAVRTTLSRMSGKGWLDSRRRGRHSFYHLTARGRQLLEEGERRIYHPPLDEPWDERWTLVAYSIPEDSRHLRDRLRVRLEWLGFGSLGNGLWISPHDPRDELIHAAGELGIREHLEIFRSEHVGFSDTEALLEACWDLPALHRRYLEFIDRLLPRFRKCKKGLAEGGMADERAFVERVGLVHEYREFPGLDPYLPGALLPEDWAGECAIGLFNAFHDLLEEPAQRHLKSVLARAPEAPERMARTPD